MSCFTSRPEDVLPLARREDRLQVVEDPLRVRDGIAREQEPVEVAGAQHLPQRLELHRAVDADEPAEAGQLEPVAELDLEAAEDRGEERVPGRAGGELGGEDGEGAEPEGLELERQGTLVARVGDEDGSAAGDRPAVQRRGVAGGRDEPHLQVEVPEGPAGLRDQLEREAEPLGGKEQGAERQRGVDEQRQVELGREGEAYFHLAELHGAELELHRDDHAQPGAAFEVDPAVGTPAEEDVAGVHREAVRQDRVQQAVPLRPHHQREAPDAAGHVEPVGAAADPEDQRGALEAAARLRIPEEDDRGRVGRGRAGQLDLEGVAGAALPVGEVR
jgi:hypothetical protein